KGDSETHPTLSPDDQFADFETYSHILGREETAAPSAADYIRSALITGLEAERHLGVNPYQFGVIGSTDAHTSLSSAEENNFWGKFALDSTPETKDRELLTGVMGNSMSASGLVAVWAEENSRESIFSAFRRREVYATSGPRIGISFFAGWHFSEDDLAAPNPALPGYTKGVTMGSQLQPPKGKRAPTFLVHAAMDPEGARLDRLQIIKGWVGLDGKGREKVYDIAWSDDRVMDDDGTLPPVGNTVDLQTGRYRNSIGATQLATVWRDPDFHASQRAFYYARVLQIPTARHTLLDAIATGRESSAAAYPDTIQERAYTSPIWYTP
ncbi:MAG: DUF3604 domain-containing protein, partial [Pseudomonadales bacterium]